MRGYDRIIDWIWFAIGGGMAIEGINLGLGKSYLSGIGFVPFLIGSSLGVCGLILVALVTLKGKEDDDKIWAGLNWKNLVLPLLSLLIYALLMEHLGFLITTFLFQFFLLKLTAPKRWLSPVFTSLLIVFCCYFVFSLWLNVPLPKGILGIG
ncbi:MAG: tripartite tricarboxylate transporter TctB family protein [Pseudomonadota bacterium]